MQSPVCVSYPKSGRTWLRTMLAELDVHLRFEHLDTSHNSSVWGKPAERIDIPRVEASKVVFLHRDPRDTAVSNFYETTIRRKPVWWRAIKFRLQGRSAPSDVDGFVRSNRFGIEKVIVFNLRCAEHLKALPIGYEGLRENTVESLGKILRYIDRPVPGQRLVQAVENNTFAEMQRREANSEHKNHRRRAWVRENPNSYKVRRGKVGGWRDELALETQEFVDDMLERYDYFARMTELTGKQLAAQGLSDRNGS